MKHILVDIETDGPVAPLYSMLSLGATCLEIPDETFYVQFMALEGAQALPEAIKIASEGLDMDEPFYSPEDGMRLFEEWLKSLQEHDKDHHRFVSDTTAFDFSFVNYYFWRFLGYNPFGHSSLSLQNIYKGMRKNARSSMHKLRDTDHTHNALDDAIGNREALDKMIAFGLKLS